VGIKYLQCVACVAIVSRSGCKRDITLLLICQFVTGGVSEIVKENCSIFKTVVYLVFLQSFDIDMPE